MLWFQLKTSLRLVDWFKTCNGVQFSWDKFHSDGARIFARLDRIYISKGIKLGDKGKKFKYFICNDSSRSDHRSISLICNFKEPTSMKTI